MSVKKIGTVAAAVAAGVGLVLGGAALANAATTSLPGAVRAATGTSGTTDGPGQGKDGQGRGMHSHTPVTGDEATKVGDAVKAKDSTVTVTKVQKDEDGSYDVLGTKAGQPVFFDVSKDLKTVTQRTGAPAGGPGGHGRGPGGGSQDTPVTGAEATKVGDAVKAKDSAVTVTGVRKDPDGSYDVLGTKAGQPVFFEVSKDLKTVTQRTGGPAGGPGGHGHGSDDGAPGAPAPAPSSSATTQSSGFSA